MSDHSTDDSEPTEGTNKSDVEKLREKIGDQLKESQDALPTHPDHPKGLIQEIVERQEWAQHTAYDKDRFGHSSTGEDTGQPIDWDSLKGQNLPGVEGLSQVPATKKGGVAPEGSGFGFAPNALDKLRLALIDARQQKEAVQNAGNGKLARQWAVCITEMEGTEARMVYFLDLDTPH